MHWRTLTMLLAALPAAPLTAQAQPSGETALVENQVAYLARCRNETITRNPSARAQADSICQSNWSQIAATGRMADAILTAAPRQGSIFDPAAVRTALSSVQWAARPEQGTLASGRLGDLDVLITRMPRPV